VRRCRAVAVHRCRPVEHDAAAHFCRMLGTPAAHQTLEFGAGHGRAELAGVRLDDADGQGSAHRCLQSAGTQRIELGEQLPQVRRGDRLPADLPDRSGIRGRAAAARL
jgi:hypothetical protein